MKKIAAFLANLPQGKTVRRLLWILAGSVLISLSAIAWRFGARAGAVVGIPVLIVALVAFCALCRFVFIVMIETSGKG